MSLQLAAVGVAIIAGLLIWTLRILNHSKKSNEKTFPDLTAQPDFNWKETEPLKARPFKAKYNLTMAIESLDPNELILMDKNYAARMEYRKRLIHSEHRDNIINVNDAAIAGPAIRELYTYLLGTYLPVRYPTMFRLQYPSKKEIEFHNLVTGDSFPVQPTEHLPLITLLQSLGYTFDEDFYFLLPETTTDGSTKYVLQAYMTVAPAGFSPLEKLGKRLADIHKPVPQYAEKLQSSMDRFFAGLNVGRHVRRLNWSVTVDADLFCPGGNDTHAYEGDQVEQLEHIDIDKTHLRCERQTLHRLPSSQAIIFAFKTYMYPIREIKDEGLGEDLAQAIDGLRQGNASGMYFYKRGAVWGEAVKRYLRDG